MYEVLKAAMPWILIAIAVAIFAVSGTQVPKPKKKRKKNNPWRKKKTTYASEGMTIGMCIGITICGAFEGFGFIHIATGASAGLLVGMIIGLFIKKD